MQEVMLDADGGAERTQRGADRDDQVLPAGRAAAAGYAGVGDPRRLWRGAPAQAAADPGADRGRRGAGRRDLGHPAQIDDASVTEHRMLGTVQYALGPHVEPPTGPDPDW